MRSHRAAAALWEALGVARDLTPDTITELIRLELAKGELTDSVGYFYGQLVRRLEKEATPGPRPAGLPALTTHGWVGPSEAWWTRRHAIREAFGSGLAWWTPGSYDPSLLARAAEWLAVSELTTENVNERWKETASGEFPETTVRRWRAALVAWPVVLRSEGLREQDADRVPSVVTSLRLLRSLSIEGELSFVDAGGEHLTVSARPSCVLRLDESVFVATSEESAFSRDAADALSILVGHERLHAANTLYALLTESRSSSEGFARKYGSLVSSVVDVELLGWDDNEHDSPNQWDDALNAIRDQGRKAEGGIRAKSPAASPQPERKFQDPAELENAFKARPALHRFPHNMAHRTQELCAAIVRDYDGDAGRVWREARTGQDLEQRLLALPGIGEMKAKTLIAIIGKRLGVKPPGWEDVAPTHPTLGDVESAESLEAYQAGKRARKAAMRAQMTNG